MDRGEAQEAGSGGPVVALLERKTTLVILSIGALMALMVCAVEALGGASNVADRWGQPLLAAALLGLFAKLRREPQALLAVQRTAVALMTVYFVAGGLYLSVLEPLQINLYYVATTYMWAFLVTVLLHITWPQRAALGWSIVLVVIITLPSLVARQHVPASLWSAHFLPMVFSGWLVQAALLLSLLSVSRLRHGVMQVLSTGGPMGPSEARKALETWLSEKTDTLAQALDTAEAASRAKSQFLAVMSHELRTPLHAMLVSADLLEDRRSGPLGEREVRLVHTIQSSGKHLLALIDQVLDLSRIEAGKVVTQSEPLNVAEVCQRAAEAVEPMALRKGLQMRVDIEPGLATQRLGDPLRLTQVLINLLANASKFTEQGRVTLRVSGQEHNGLRFVVVDTGPGMSQRAQQRVFDAFYQVDDQSTRLHGGVGLGLTITRELVELMGGQLELFSAEGAGTQVVVSLPLPIDPQEHQPPSAPTGEHDRLNGVRVLVVEDDPVNAMLACEVLRGVGAQVFSQDSGAAALRFLQAQEVDVVLMDFRMPGMDGLETTRRMRDGQGGEFAKQVPVLGLTANAFMDDRDLCLLSGMSDVLTKPIERRALIRAVHDWHRAAA